MEGITAPLPAVHTDHPLPGPTLPLITVLVDRDHLIQWAILIPGEGGGEVTSEGILEEIMVTWTTEKVTQKVTTQTSLIKVITRTIATIDVITRTTDESTTDGDTTTTIRTRTGSARWTPMQGL